MWDDDAAKNTAKSALNGMRDPSFKSAGFYSTSITGGFRPLYGPESWGINFGLWPAFPKRHISSYSVAER
jgi:hypothetical protein